MGEHIAEVLLKASSDAFNRQAKKSGGVIKQQYKVAGHSLDLHFAEPGLANVLAKALSHSTSPTVASPDLTIRILGGHIEELEPGISLDQKFQIPLERQGKDHLNPVYSFSNGAVRGLYEVGAGVLSILDRQHKLAVYWIRDKDQIPFYVAASPFRNLFQWWLAGKGIQILHGGAVGLKTGGVFFGGQGGHGKSTVSFLSALNSELKYLGDDFVALGEEKAPTLYSLYSSGKLESANLVRFPNLATFVSNRDRLDYEKAVIYFKEHMPTRLIDQFPLKAIVLPRISNEDESRLLPASPAECLKAIAPTTMFLFYEAPQKAFHRLGQLVRLVPGFVLELGKDMSDIPRLILNLIHNPL